MPFPAAKLFSVALRQLSKPMAACLQKTAQGNEYFKGACVSMATRYHIMEQRIINRFYDKDGKNEFIPKLNEENAVKLGATIMGEAFIFGVAGKKLKAAASAILCGVSTPAVEFCGVMRGFSRLRKLMESACTLFAVKQTRSCAYSSLGEMGCCSVMQLLHWCSSTVAAP